VVDRLDGEDQTVLKPLLARPPDARRGGSALLGDGKIALILDVLLRAARWKPRAFQPTGWQGS